MFFSSLGVVVNMVLSTIKRSGEVIQLRTTSPEPIYLECRREFTESLYLNIANAFSMIGAMS